MWTPQAMHSLIEESQDLHHDAMAATVARPGRDGRDRARRPEPTDWSIPMSPVRWPPAGPP